MHWVAAAVSAALVAGGNSSDDQRLLYMTSLYEQVCLKAFPNDEAVETLMKAREARELSPREVKVTMRDDPARAWELKAERATVWIELPPFHACSVRWGTPQVGDLGVYRALADRYESARGGFRPIGPFDSDQGDIHVHAVGEGRLVPGGTEALFLFYQNISDPKRRAAGETGVELRFVHQFAPPPPPLGGK